MPEPPLAWLVLPTYNEVSNVEPIVEAIRAHLREPRRLLVVDDASPDGTGRIAERLAMEHDDVAVIHRPAKEGIGPAYVEGFRAALRGGAELVCQMDADFSHDPAALPHLVEAAAAADVVLGSRYVPGGGVKNWGAVRRAISRAGSAYARTLLGVNVRDLTGGFKVFRRRVLEAIDLDSISSLGYAFQVETTYRAVRAGFEVVEVPIIFSERRVGESKMTGGIILEAARKVPAMRIRGR